MHELKFASTTNIRAKYSPHTGHTRQRRGPAAISSTTVFLVLAFFFCPLTIPVLLQTRTPYLVRAMIHSLRDDSSDTSDWIGS